MGFEAVGLVGFIAIDVETHECDFEVVGKDIEHLDRIAVGIFHLLGGFSVNGGGQGGVVFGEDALQEHRKGVVNIFDGGFVEGTKECCFDRRFFSLEFQWFFKDFPVSFCPAIDFGNVGHSGDEDEENEREHPVIGMGHALFGARVGQGVEDGGE